MTVNEKILTENISVSTPSGVSLKMPPDVLCHAEYEILYVISGGARCISEGREHLLSRGALLLSRPLEYKSIEFNSDELFSGYIITFSEKVLSDDISDILLRITEPSGGAYYSPDNCSPELRAIFERFDIVKQLREPEREAFAALLISEIIILLSASSREDKARATENLAARVGGYINSNLRAELTLDELAKRFFVNKYYLCRTFKAQSGISIHSYISMKRVLYAKSLMESGESAAAAAEKSGFGDYSAFYRAYIKIYSIPPTSKSHERSLL